mgnify:CR=1 FL=1
MFKGPNIQFLTTDYYFDYVPHPKSAKFFLPDWFKKVKNHMTKGTDLSVRSCAPFADSLNAGYIIPAPFDYYFKVTDYGVNVSWEYRDGVKNIATEKQLPGIQQHTPEQAAGLPWQPPILKLVSPWQIKTKKGWSVIITEPFNKESRPIHFFQAVVDSDAYESPLNFPFRIINRFNQQEFEFFIKAGDPLVQVIPVQRSSLYNNPTVRTYRRQELKDARITTKLVNSRWNYYLNNVWKRRKP